MFHVCNNDVFYVNWNGAGGVRDPLQRDLALVCRDVAEGVVSARAAKNLYGVVLSSDGNVDSAATQSLRLSMRSKRTTATNSPAGARKKPRLLKL